MEKSDKKLQTNLFLRHFIPQRLKFCKKNSKELRFFPINSFVKFSFHLYILKFDQ